MSNAAQTSATGLAVDNVSFAYGEGDTILRRVALEVPEGQFLTLLGPSGSGKSTLLRLIAGLEAPTDGRLAWQGATITGPGIDRAVVFQNYSLFPWLKVEDNVALAVAKAHPKLSRAERRQRLDRARDYLGRVGLADAAGKYPFQLSGGMQQRAAIARALALEAPVLLMDEPFGALDAFTREQMQELLLQVWRRTAKPVFLITHDIEEAVFLATDLILLAPNPGQIVERLHLDFGQRYAAGESARAIKSDPRFIETREHVLGKVFSQRQVSA